MKILVSCEESQRVCMAFRDKGHEAYSCDIIEPSGGHIEWHILGDALEALRGGQITTMDGVKHDIGKWDMIIAFPPCTYLSTVATRRHSLRCRTLKQINERTEKRIEAMRFFMEFINAPCEKIAVENPMGVMNTAYRSPDCIISPWMFATDENDEENYIQKRTCLWLKGLPPLVQTNELDKPNLKEIFGTYPSGKTGCWVDSVGGKDRAKIRSKTFPGIAKAMADQWG